MAIRGARRELCRVVAVGRSLIERPGRVVIPGLAFVHVRFDLCGSQGRRSGGEIEAGEDLAGDLGILDRRDETGDREKTTAF